MEKHIQTNTHGRKRLKNTSRYIAISYIRMIKKDQYNTIPGKIISRIRNRKIRRKVADKFYGAILHKNAHHIIDTLPEMMMTYSNDNWNVKFKGKDIGIIPSSINYNNENTVNLIGSGPSINNHSLNHLENEHVILMNGSITLCNTYNFKKLSYVIIDSTFVSNRYSLIEKSTPNHAHIYITPGVLHCFLEFNINFCNGKNITIIENIKEKYPKDRPATLTDLHTKNIHHTNESSISTDINTGYFDGGTVMYVAAQLALTWRPDAINIFGFDLGNSSGPRFNEDKSSQLKSGLLKDYRRLILPNMTLLSMICKENKITLRNLSEISIFPSCIIRKYKYQKITNSYIENTNGNH